MSLRARMWIELVLAFATGLATVATVIWPTWIEALFEASPDGGDGSAERLFALAWLAATVFFAVLARRDRRHLAHRPARTPG